MATSEAVPAEGILVLEAIDDQLRLGCDCEGLKKFMLAVDRVDRPANPLSWPSVSISSECGCDIWCAMQFLTREASMNCSIDIHPDINHNAWNSAKGALKKVGCWSFILLMLASKNMRHGPWAQGMRLLQCDQALTDFLELENFEDGVLFKDMYPKILKDYGMEDRISEPGMEEWVWQQLADAHPWKVSHFPAQLCW